MDDVPQRRVEWVDNGRMIAALLVIFLHVSFVYPAQQGGVVEGIVFHWAYRGDVPFFLFFAGYFLARNITWGKAFKRSALLLIPFVIWNVLYYLFHAIPAGHGGQFFEQLPSIFGLGSLFTPDIHFVAGAAVQPKITVSWFLRDIILLSPLTVLAARYKGVLAVVLVLMFATFPTCNEHSEIYNSMLSPGTCFFYFLGVLASRYSLQDAHLILNGRFTAIMVSAVILGASLGAAISMKWIPNYGFTLPAGMLGVLVIAHGGMLIERHCPKLSMALSACAPASFLIYMLHLPIMQISSCFLPDCFLKSPLVWGMPFIVTGIIILLWMCMRRLTPWLLPVLAHDKWRR